MKVSCITHPTNEHFIKIHPWQIDACDGNECAAALLSFFEYFHNVKLEQALKAKQFNDVSEFHGDTRAQDETLYQFHSEDELERGVVIYKRRSMYDALKLLDEKGFVTLHHNPYNRYKFDKTRYFLFHPEVVNAWLATYDGEGWQRMCATRSRKFADTTCKFADSTCKFADGEKGPVTTCKNADRSRKNAAPSRKIAGSIPKKSDNKSDQDTHPHVAGRSDSEVSAAEDSRTGVGGSGRSKFSLEECRRWAEHLHRTGQGITNPGGYAKTIHRTGEDDHQIEQFLVSQSHRAPSATMSPNVSQCPDCHGTGFWYPQGVGHGVAKCKHQRLREEQFQASLAASEGSPSAI
ncbi:MAG: hypothetical protein M3Q91_09135 [Acidobacteriota bacterium]|nr:hypothetical protein [Acidobacteriota bacterium]